MGNLIPNTSPEEQEETTHCNENHIDSSREQNEVGRSPAETAGGVPGKTRNSTETNSSSCVYVDDYEMAHPAQDATGS